MKILKSDFNEFQLYLGDWLFSFNPYRFGFGYYIIKFYNSKKDAKMWFAVAIGIGRNMASFQYAWDFVFHFEILAFLMKNKVLAFRLKIPEFFYKKQMREHGNPLQQNAMRFKN